MMDIIVLPSIAYKFFDKKTGSGIIIEEQQAEESHLKGKNVGVISSERIWLITYHLSTCLKIIKSPGLFFHKRN